MNNKIIAFSWIANTGKSYIINELSKNVNSKIYKEIARKHFNILNEQWIKKFQEKILEEEKIRLFNLLTNVENKNIFIDRTFIDNLIYTFWGMFQGNINKIDLGDDIQKYINLSIDIYDEVILFTEALKETKNAPLPNTNDDIFNQLFIYGIQSIYKDKVKIYKNSEDYIEQNKELFNK